ncbi:MAG: hypothetical protein SFV18_18415 [Bryobacteraceae bacterium]|nr:hypothetical protein [Bryobacteraceae bacterium]
MEPQQAYERIICIVPIIGAGTPEDPRRPMFAPADPAKERIERIRAGGDSERPDSGIMAFTFQESDDGRRAIVEFVARSQEAFRPIMNSGRADVRVFRRGRVARAELLTELRRVKRDFDLDNFGVAAQ